LPEDKKSELAEMSKKKPGPPPRRAGAGAAPARPGKTGVQSEETRAPGQQPPAYAAGR